MHLENYRFFNLGIFNIIRCCTPGTMLCYALLFFYTHLTKLKIQILLPKTSTENRQAFTNAHIQELGAIHFFSLSNPFLFLFNACNSATRNILFLGLKLNPHNHPHHPAITEDILYLNCSLETDSAECCI